MSGDLNPCERTLARLVRFSGRIREVVRAKGRFIYPSDVENVLKHFTEISKYQLVVSHSSYKDRLILVAELLLEDIDKGELKTELIKSLKEHCILNLDTVEHVSVGSIKGEKIVLDERKWN